MKMCFEAAFVDVLWSLSRVERQLGSQCLKCGIWTCLNNIHWASYMYVHIHGFATRSCIFFVWASHKIKSCSQSSKSASAVGLTAEGDQQCAKSFLIFLTTLNYINPHVCVYLQCFTHTNCVDFSQFAWSSPTFKPKRSRFFFFFFPCARCPGGGGELEPAEYKDTAFSWPGGTVNRKRTKKKKNREVFRPERFQTLSTVFGQCAAALARHSVLTRPLTILKCHYGAIQQRVENLFSAEKGQAANTHPL